MEATGSNPLKRPRTAPGAEYLRRVRDNESGRESTDTYVVPTKLFRATEVARHFNLTRQTVHNYATIGLITERERTPGGQRLFDESVFRRLHRIQHMKRRYRLHEIRRLLDDEESSAVAADAAAGPDRPAPEDTPHRDR